MTTTVYVIHFLVYIIDGLQRYGLIMGIIIGSKKSHPKVLNVTWYSVILKILINGRNNLKH